MPRQVAGCTHIFLETKQRVMKEIELYAGCNIDKALEIVKREAADAGEVCFAKFNGKEVYSTDTTDEAYMRLLGKTKAEFDEDQRKWREDYHRREEEFKARIPKLTETYRKRARGLVIESELEHWDEVVPIRLGDCYHGMELGQTLDICKIMRDETLTADERLHKAYDLFMESGHSGRSAHITAQMIAIFCPDGKDLADAVINFRFKKEKD